MYQLELHPNNIKLSADIAECVCQNLSKENRNMGFAICNLTARRCMK